ncbi:hypothetical protein EDC01DRAFT_631350 [Geopyxis carbonaria]|nr:hypothetical protein EDC01DRAFT_631350 [Geopyxis carbonaria]
MAGITTIVPHDRAIMMASRFIHYFYPAGLFFWFAASQAVSLCTLANLRAPSRKARRSLFVWMQLLLLVSYTIEACLLISRSLVQKGWWSPQDNVTYLLSSIIVWGVIEVALVDTRNPVWYPYYGAWSFAFCTELGLLIVSAKCSDTSVIFESLKLGVQLCRFLAIAVMPVLVWTLRAKDPQPSDKDEESTGLLSGEPENNASYGAIDSDSETGAEAQAMRKKLEKSGNWWTYTKSFARGVNVMVPHQLGVVTNALSKGGFAGQVESYRLTDLGPAPWLEIFLFALYRWLDSASGISALQTYLWMPVEQYSYRSITTAAYNHVMSLSYDFHSNKKTGELWMSISQGRSINGLIDIVLFAILPMFADLFIAFTYFFVLFNSYMAMIVAVVSIVYLWATAKLSAMRSQIRRDLNQTARNETTIMVETVSSWTTVSYFNRVPYEQNRYHEAIRKYQGAEWRWQIGISMINVVQSLIFTVGLLAASFLAVYEVTQGKAPVGSFVSLLSYWAQLSRPLMFFANLFRRIQNQMLDTERMLELFLTKPSVTDRPDALELEKVDGAISFNNVGFSYDTRKPILKDLSFSAPPGSTVALVGETGGGKTTCLKLLFRFYDVETGSITVDGHDIRDLKVSSLRDFMGVVPQDPKLFNDTIISNIKYANFDVTDEDVYEACRAASIHDKIMSFPDGYLSKVGEHGIRLSGGELQRVAIARAILRKPKIILLDEATSMVDMETERQIQSALQRLSKGRTVIVVAHRLSTIMNADLILVIGDGTVVEKGNHQELMAKKGKYSKLWSKQLKNETPKPKPDGNPLESLIQDNSNKTLGECGDTLVPKKQSDLAIGSTQPHLQTGDDSQQIVTFSLPNRSSSITQIQKHALMNPRLTIPQQSILKGLDVFQGPTQSSAGKPACVLKPDAMEFIPKTTASSKNSTSSKKELKSHHIDNSPVDNDPSRIFTGQTSLTSEIRPDSAANKTISNRTGSEGQDMTEYQAVEKRRRHRTRRRTSSESQQASEQTNANNDLENSSTEGLPTATKMPPRTVEISTGPEPNSEIDGNSSGRNPRRRFQSLSKINKVESENEDPNPAKLKGIESSSKRQGNIYRSKSFKGQRPRLNFNEEDMHDQNLKDGNPSTKVGNSTSVTGSEASRAKNSGNNSKGSWRKGKAPKNKDTGSSTTSS